MLAAYGIGAITVLSFGELVLVAIAPACCAAGKRFLIFVCALTTRASAGRWSTCCHPACHPQGAKAYRTVLDQKSLSRVAPSVTWGPIMLAAFR
jgi:hypothetical protein